MNFILITGPPAVGKMTVGQELSKLTDYCLFHNHHSIDLTLNFFDYGDPEFGTINDGVRQLIFNTVANSKSLAGLIFTLVWAFDDQSDIDYVEELKQKFTTQGWGFYIVELSAPLTTRLERNGTPNRLKNKPSKSDVKKSDENLVKMGALYRMNSQEGEIEEPNYLKIDNSNKSATEVAQLIVQHFDF